MAFAELLFQHCEGVNGENQVAKSLNRVTGRLGWRDTEKGPFEEIILVRTKARIKPNHMLSATNEAQGVRSHWWTTLPKKRSFRKPRTKETSALLRVAISLPAKHRASGRFSEEHSLLSFMQHLIKRLSHIWRQLPLPLRQRLYSRLFKPGGLPHSLSYLANFYESHNRTKFAGNLLTLKEEYWQSAKGTQELLSQRFIEIVDNLVLKNGVTKTTHFGRQKAILSTIFGGGKPMFETEAIRVLDVPSSIGIASLDTYDFLSQQYKISSYVLGDLCFEVLYDRDRECVFDDAGNLLQVKRNDRFFSLYCPHTSGDFYSIFVSTVLVPLEFRSWLAKRRLPFMPGSRNVPIVLLHPEAVHRVSQGLFRLQKVDVFSQVQGEFDLILSFNLLQKNYFSQNQIDIGIDNLKKALSENGLLIMGNDKSFCVSKRIGEKLVVLERNGDF